MHNAYRWLLALSLSVCLLPATAWAEDGGAIVTGSIEAGAASVDIDDDNTRINEYPTYDEDEGGAAYGNLDLNVEGDNSYFNLEADIAGDNNQDVDLSFETNRMLRGSIKYQSMEHIKDHDLLNYLDAAISRGGMDSKDADGDGSTAKDISATGVTPDAVPAFILFDSDGNALYGAKDKLDLVPLANPGDYIIQTGGASLYGEDLLPGQDFVVTRKEAETGIEFTHPSIANVTFDVNFRQEVRQGTEQAISMSKCAGCHVVGESKEIDETTEDISLGATGKFGLLTVRYELSRSEFNNKAASPTAIYDPVIKPGQPFDNATFDNRMSYDYDDGELPYATSPESEKDSHLLKARVDLPNKTSIIGSYLTSTTESKKSEEDGIFSLSDLTLTTDYDGYGLRAVTRLTDRLRLSAKLKVEKIDSDDVEITYYPITAPTSPTAGLTFGDPAVTEYSSNREASASRDNLTANLDLTYRLGRKTNLRLGYEYEKEDRDDVEFGETESNLFKASVKTRPAKGVMTRLSYTYQDIDNAFHNPHAANVELTDNRSTLVGGVLSWIVFGNNDVYGTSFYDARRADLTNQPEKIHEAKFATTWSPSPLFSATISYRFKDEENDLNLSRWQQTTHAPGLSMWYAADEKLNLVMTYNYFDQRSETAFCQGFYDG
jgi:hypothetical protein